MARVPAYEMKPAGGGGGGKERVSNTATENISFCKYGRRPSPLQIAESSSASCSIPRLAFPTRLQFTTATHLAAACESTEVRRRQPRHGAERGLQCQNHSRISWRSTAASRAYISIFIAVVVPDRGCASRVGSVVGDHFNVGAVGGGGGGGAGQSRRRLSLESF